MEMRAILVAFLIKTDKELRKQNRDTWITMIKDRKYSQ